MAGIRHATIPVPPAQVGQPEWAEEHAVDDGAFTIAKTVGLQAALDGKEPLWQVGTAYVGADRSGGTRGSGALDIQPSRAGGGQIASGASAIAIGTSCTAGGDESLALGVMATTGGFRSIAQGFLCTASAANAQAYGDIVAVDGLGCIGLGANMNVGFACQGAVVVGRNMTAAAGTEFCSVGYGNTVGGTRTVSCGFGLTVTQNTSVGVGIIIPEPPADVCRIGVGPTGFIGGSGFQTAYLDISSVSGDATFTTDAVLGRFNAAVLRTPPTTVASLGSAATAGAGARRFVTDSSSTTFAAVVTGGGANGVPVYSDGTDWRIG